MMFKRVLAICVCVLGLSVFATPNVEAGYWLNGKYYTKGVQCDAQGQVKNVDKNQLSLACTIDPPVNEPQEVILVCQNGGGHIGTGRVFTQNITFNTGFAVGTSSPDKKGVANFIGAIVNAAGVATTRAECDANPACVELRQLCININGNDATWVPVDAIPIKMIATVADYFCDNDGLHTCPCDPSITNTTDVHACATSLGGGNPPWSFNWSLTGGLLVPAGKEKSSCVLPNPETYVFGEQRPYNCTVIP
ncbi:MAG: hypothetical protein U0223_17270 [Nitrospira sp.]|nr:hypothetical protein [Nitrospira sp.]